MSCLVFAHASPTHFVMRTRHSDADIFPSIYFPRFSFRCLSDMALVKPLNGSLNDTSTGCTKDVQHPGIFTSFVLHMASNIFIFSVCWARWISATSILPSDAGVDGLRKKLFHSDWIHLNMVCSSHQAFSWKNTVTLLSHAFFPSPEDLAHCSCNKHLWSPGAHMLPSSNMNGRGVWSILTRSHKSYFPTRRK